MAANSSHINLQFTIYNLQFTIYNLGSAGVEVEVVDLYGKVLETRNPEPGTSKLELDISNYPAGIYFIRINLENQTIVKKIIKL